MQLHGEQRLYSATDLASFLPREHLTALALQALSDRVLAALRVGSDESAALIAQKGDEHERACLRSLQEVGRLVVVADTEANKVWHARAGWSQGNQSLDMTGVDSAYTSRTLLPRPNKSDA